MSIKVVPTDSLKNKETKGNGGTTDLIHGFGEAVEIIDSVVLGDDVDGGFVGLPVGRNHKNGSGPLPHDLLLPWLEKVPGRQRFVDREGGGSVRYVEGVYEALN